MSSGALVEAGRSKAMRYIEIGNSWCSWRHNLSDNDLHTIGEFTTENILRWLKTSSRPFSYTEPLMDPSITLVEFHAVSMNKLSIGRLKSLGRPMMALRLDTATTLRLFTTRYILSE